MGKKTFKAQLISTFSELYFGEGLCSSSDSNSGLKVFECS
jgi:hypothetical protein